MERHPTKFWSPCAAHCIDLMLEEIGKLEWVESCVEREKNICKFIYNHSFFLSIMRKYTVGKELARPGIMMFASNFITLESLLTSRDDLRSMFVGREWISSSYAMTTARIDVVDCIFDDDGFGNLLEKSLRSLSPLYLSYELLMGRSPLRATYMRAWIGPRRPLEPSMQECRRSMPLFGVSLIGDHKISSTDPCMQAYFLNPAFRFLPDFKADEEVLTNLYTMIQRLSNDEGSVAAIIELDKFNNKEGPLFSGRMAIDARATIQPDKWWQMFWATTSKLQKIAIRILSQPSNASGCEHSWSMFEHIHSKRRNWLIVQRLNDLVFVRYNLSLWIRQILGADSSSIILEEIDPELEWLTEVVDLVFIEEGCVWVDQVDIEAEVVAMAEEVARARSGTGRRTRACVRTNTGPSDVVHEPILHVGDMARRSSRIYLRPLSSRQTRYSEAEAEAEAKAAIELEDDDEA